MKKYSIFMHAYFLFWHVPKTQFWKQNVWNSARNEGKQLYAKLMQDSITALWRKWIEIL